VIQQKKKKTKKENWGWISGYDAAHIPLKSSVAIEVLKCIHIGLFCVQEDPADRPTMSFVLVMLASDTITLPIPKRPAFSVGRLVAVEAQSSNQKVCSVNELTISVLSPRWL